MYTVFIKQIIQQMSINENKNTWNTVIIVLEMIHTGMEEVASIMTLRVITVFYSPLTYTVE
jgi:hypothetical protein